MSLKTTNLDLKKRIDVKIKDDFTRKAIANAQDVLNKKRNEGFNQLGNYEKWRELASDIRMHVLENLDYYLNEFVENAEKTGAKVYFAKDGKEANEIAKNIFVKNNFKTAVKSKSMVTEEIGLNEILEEIGVEVVESDLGEYLLQVDDKDKPSHIVVPALHKDRDRIREVLNKKNGYTGDNVPENMTKFVRKHLRQKFVEADVGITGCNFGIAESGTVSLMTNEGNARLATSLPKTHIAFMGLERVLPSFKELDIIFSMLARSAVGARATTYMTLLTGPKEKKDIDGPEDMHIIIIDNGRSKVLESEAKEILKCIRCGTCMLECPVYRHISGHGYGTLYPGPLGLSLVPSLGGYNEFGDIIKVCSLCGACNDVCPIKAPLYETIFEHRRIVAEDKKMFGLVEDTAMGIYGNVIGNSSLYEAGTKIAHLGNFAPKVGPLAAWGKYRTTPHLQKERFRDWYKKRKKCSVKEAKNNG